MTIEQRDRARLLEKAERLRQAALRAGEAWQECQQRAEEIEEQLRRGTVPPGTGAMMKELPGRQQVFQDALQRYKTALARLGLEDDS